MVLPTPPVRLESPCAVIFDGSLYTFQSGAFQRLPLTQGAQWEAREGLLVKQLDEGANGLQVAKLD